MVSLYFFHESEPVSLLTTLQRLITACCEGVPVKGLTFTRGLFNVPYEVALGVLDSVDSSFTNYPNAVIIENEGIRDVFLKGSR